MTSAALHTTVTTIFVAVNAILCQETIVHNDDQRNFVSISSNDNSKIDPLPSKIFHRPLTNFLSPEMFSQPNILDYFVTKAAKYSGLRIQTMIFSVNYFLDTKKFPQSYIGYATVLSSLLPCLVKLQFLKTFIVKIQNADEFSYAPLPSDIPTPDNRFLAFFSKEIFLDDNPPLIILLKLLDMPEDKCIEARIWLNNLLYGKIDFPQNYRKYINNLSSFLHSISELKKLKTSIDKLRSTVSA